MSGPRARCLIALAVGWLLLLPASQAVAQAPTGLRIGLATSLYRGLPEPLMQILAKPLNALMEHQTGMTGQVRATGDPVALGRMLEDNKIDLAVFHGFEFAWIVEKHPNLKPLLLSCNPAPLQAFLIVKQDSPVQTPAELKGSALAIPVRSRGHLYLFLERRVCSPGMTSKEFFSRMTTTSDTENALDDVLEGNAQAALVDRAGLEEYRRSSPKRASKLRVLAQSEVFPTGVLVYNAAVLTAETARRIQEGMVNAHKNKRGKDLLDLCKMDGFEVPSAAFHQALQEINRSYPAPAEK